MVLILILAGKTKLNICGKVLEIMLLDIMEKLEVRQKILKA